MPRSQELSQGGAGSRWLSRRAFYETTRRLVFGVEMSRSSSFPNVFSGSLMFFGEQRMCMEGFWKWMFQQRIFVAFNRNGSDGL